MAQVQSWGTLVCVPPHGIMAASNSDDRRGVAKTEVKRKIDNDSTKPLAKRFKQIHKKGPDQANHVFLMKLHRRIVAIEASLEAIRQMLSDHINEKKALGNYSAKLGQSRSTTGQKSFGSCGISVQVSHDDMDHAAGVVNIGSLVRLTHSPDRTPSFSPLTFVSAREVLGGKVSGIRWIYECYLTRTDYTIRGGDGKKEVTTILTCDHTGPLLISIWQPTLDVFKNIMQQHNPEHGQLMLRFEQFRFAPMLKNRFNGKIVTPMCLIHTLSREPDVLAEKRQSLQPAISSMSIHDGTRLTMIREATSPYMRKGINYCTPQPPLVVMSYKENLSKAVSPFRVTIAGTIHDLQEAEPANSGKLRRNFKLADEQGNWVHCVAHGRHADNNSLKNFLKIVIYFSSGRRSTGHSPQAIWIFNDAFMVPLERRIGSSLSEQVEWQ